MGISGGAEFSFGVWGDGIFEGEEGKCIFCSGVCECDINGWNRVDEDFEGVGSGEGSGGAVGIGGSGSGVAVDAVLVGEDDVI